MVLVVTLIDPPSFAHGLIAPHLALRHLLLSPNQQYRGPFRLNFEAIQSM